MLKSVFRKATFAHVLSRIPVTSPPTVVRSWLSVTPTLRSVASCLGRLAGSRARRGNAAAESLTPRTARLARLSRFVPTAGAPRIPVYLK